MNSENYRKVLVKKTVNAVLMGMDILKEDLEDKTSTEAELKYLSGRELDEEVKARKVRRSIRMKDYDNISNIVATLVHKNSTSGKGIKVYVEDGHWIGNSWLLKALKSRDLEALEGIKSIEFVPVEWGHHGIDPDSVDVPTAELLN